MRGKKVVKLFLIIAVVLILGSINLTNTNASDLKKSFSNKKNIKTVTLEPSNSEIWEFNKPTFYGAVSRVDFGTNYQGKIYMHHSDYDGVEQYMPVSYTKSLTGQYMYSCNVGVLQFDTSSIPDDKEILEVKLRTYVTELTKNPLDDYDIWNANMIKLKVCDITVEDNLRYYYTYDTDPEEYDYIDGNDRLLDDARSGVLYCHYYEFLVAGHGWFPSGYSWLALSDYASYDLQSGLGNDIFILGLSADINDLPPQDELYFGGGIVLSGGKAKLEVTYCDGVDDTESPSRPSKPNGPTNVRTGEYNEYSSVATDPQGDDIFYLFDWSDGSNSGWLGPYKSGEEVTEPHYFWDEGTYVIRVKARDVNDHYSDWSNPLPVAAPKCKSIFIFHRIQNLFPNIYNILKNNRL